MIMDCAGAPSPFIATVQAVYRLRHSRQPPDAPHHPRTVGPLGEVLADSILDRALDPPAYRQLTVAATRFSSKPLHPTLDAHHDTARLVHAEYPYLWGQRPVCLSR